MDIFSHTLWGGGLFGFRGHFKLALFFGAFPDLISFGLFFIVRVLDGNFMLGPPSLNSVPPWVFFTYHLGHSFITAFIVIALISLWKKNVALAMLGWPFHICLDFPFHAILDFPTKILWPVSDFAIDGIPWWNAPWICLSNLAGILVLLLWRWHHWYKKRKKTRT